MKEYKITDSELIQKINDNNEDAKDYLYQKYSLLIHKEVNRIKKLGIEKGIEYNDLLQDAMLAFSEAINKYDDESNVKFITFATLCIRRKLINTLHKYSTQKEYMNKNQIHLEDGLEDKKPVSNIVGANNIDEPLKKMLVNESLNETFKSLGTKLSDNERKAILLDIEGNSIDDIAKIMNIKPKQVYNLLYRGRKKLKFNWFISC